MLRKIQMSFSQDGINPHGLQMLFSWAKEDFKYERLHVKPLVLVENCSPKM